MHANLHTHTAQHASFDDSRRSSRRHSRVHCEVSTESITVNADDETAPLATIPQSPAAPVRSMNNVIQMPKDAKGKVAYAQNWQEKAIAHAKAQNMEFADDVKAFLK
jgi:hypothetical protein